MEEGELVIGYARISVSSEDINNQVKAIEEYCRKKGYKLLIILKDTITGIANPLERKEFRKILEYSNDFGVRKVIITEISRLGRSLSEIYNALRILSENNIVVEFVKHQELNNMDERTYSVFITAFGLASELERKFLKMRVQMAKQSGKTIGRPPIKLPIKEIEKYRKQGLSKKDIYRLLVGKGLLRKKDGKPITYIQFLRRLKALEINNESEE